MIDPECERIVRNWLDEPWEWERVLDRARRLVERSGCREAQKIGTQLLEAAEAAMHVCRECLDPLRVNGG